jgi:stage 0 sporulation regulatory protein
VFFFYVIPFKNIQNILNFANVLSERRDIMAPSNEMVREIEELRELLHQLMNKKILLTDPELVALSQKLDKLLNQYNELIK